MSAGLSCILEEYVANAISAGVLPATAYVRGADVSAHQYYAVCLAVCNAVARQQPGFSVELLHQLINLQFPVLGPWCPVYVPPPVAGTYTLAHAYAVPWAASALYRPAKGAAWGRWYPPSGKRVALPLLPGDRWRAL